MTDTFNPWAVMREYQLTSEMTEAEFPELWKKCYPRRYEEPGKTQYDTPKAVARSMMDALLSYHAISNKTPGTTEQQQALWASVMAKYGVPTCYLSHDIALALTHTTPTQKLDCMNITIPFEAEAFMLPKDILVHPEYGYVSFVAYVRGRQGASFLSPHPRPQVRHQLDVMNDIFTVFFRTVTGMMLHWTYDSSISIVDLKNEAELEELQRNYSHTSRTSLYSQDFTPADIATMTRAIKLLFNIILIITQKPILVESAQLLKRVNKGAGKFIEYWKPRIIGRTYKLRYEKHEPTGTHASPEGHWVSGCWRTQHYGPQFSLSKEILIDPYWRGGSIEND